jgi:hypothetical protein
MTPLASDHLDLSARLSSRHRRRHTPLPRGAGRRRWGASRFGSRSRRGRAFLTGVDACGQRSTVRARATAGARPGPPTGRTWRPRAGRRAVSRRNQPSEHRAWAMRRGGPHAGDGRCWQCLVSPEHAECLDRPAQTQALLSEGDASRGRASTGRRGSLQQRPPAPLPRNSHASAPRTSASPDRDDAGGSPGNGIHGTREDPGREDGCRCRPPRRMGAEVDSCGGPGTRRRPRDARRRRPRPRRYARPVCEGRRAASRRPSDPA